MKNAINIFLMLVIILLLIPDNSYSIPAFARKYDMSCMVCHSPFPKLKAYGDEFAGNGFQLKDKEAPRFTRETGDSKLFLMRELPLALRFDGFARFQTKTDTKNDIEWPYYLKILSGGLIAKDVSYYIYFLLSERGEVAGIEDAFVSFNKIGNIELDLTFGQYQVSDPLFKRELRPTFEDYWIYKVRPGKSHADLTYDRGIMANYTIPGLETDIFLSLVNGNGIGPAENKLFDNDPYKNLFIRIAQPLHSIIQVGTMGYIGKERSDGINNKMEMVGADVTVEANELELSGQYIYRRDNNPFFDNSLNDVDTYGGFFQFMYSPDGDKSDWYTFLLYNFISSDIESLRYESFAANFTYLLARNFKIIGEVGYDFEQRKSSLTVGFTTAM